MNRPQAPSFKISKTYMNKVMKTQAKYVVCDGENVSSSKNPIEGIAPCTDVAQVKSKVPGAFKMHKTFYAVSDR
jgi:hypothetical protein